MAEWRSARCRPKTVHPLHARGRKDDRKMANPEVKSHTGGRRTTLLRLLSKVKRVRVGRKLSDDTTNLVEEAAMRERDRVQNKEDPKPKKRGWKKIRRAASATCRYIGLGMASMYPMGPDYLSSHIYFGEQSQYHTGYFNSNDPQWLAGLAFTRW